MSEASSSPSAELDAEFGAVLALLEAAIPAILPGPNATGWPYWLENGQPRGEPAHSQSTSAMIGYALAAFTGCLSDRDELAGPTLSFREASPRHASSAEQGFGCALEALRDLDEASARRDAPVDQDRQPPSATSLATTKQGNDDIGAATSADENPEPPRDETVVLTRSTLFGDDDPFTLDWILRLCKATEGASSQSYPSGLPERIAAIAMRKLAVIRDRGPEDFTLDARHPDSGGSFVTHLWTVLRVAYLARNCDSLDDFGTLEERLYRYFAAELAKQLGYAEVRDSSFEAAQLVFALDGLTLCKPTSPHAGLLHRSIEIIVNSHKVDPKLQPRRPFKVTNTGGVHIPIAVEVFQSVIRVVRRLSTTGQQFDALSQLLPVLRRYTTYLQASIVDVSVAGENFVYRGWASDHEFSSSAKIETWYTAQVIIYLLMYGTLLREHAARVHLDEVGLQTSSVNRAIDGFFTAGETLSEIARDFAPDRPNTRLRWSFLLYGPPGTGKTTIVEQLARSVGWPILELSPSHFVVRGVDRVEERASQLFRALGHQDKIVVLFDEIDRLVLDRSSEQYGEQGDMFQFMTPSMLTKLNALRKAEHLVFAIATNYAWRIDSAILRPGRVDRSYLVLPPNVAVRRHQISGYAADADPEVVEILVKRTVLASWSEIEALCELLAPSIQRLSPEQAEDACEVLSPTIQLRNYDRELRAGLSGKPAEYLLRELAGLYDLLSEVSAPPELASESATSFLIDNSNLLARLDRDRAERVSRWLDNLQ